MRARAVCLSRVASPSIAVSSPWTRKTNLAAAFRWWRLPADGLGLARMEPVVSNAIKVHPLALTRVDEIRDETVRAQIEALTRSYDDKRGHFIDKLAQGLSRIAAVYFPIPSTSG